MKKFLLPFATVALAIFAACRPALPTASGTIEVDEARVASRYGGRVERVFAREGDALTNGQPLVQLDAAELRAHRARAAAQLAEAEAGPRREEISAVRAEWEAQSAQAEFARADAKRAEELFALKTVSAAERDAATMRASSLEKTAVAAKARLDLLLAGTRAEQLAAARAQLAALDAQLREMQIATPDDAVLEVLHVRPGDVLAPNQPAATLLLTNHLWLRVFVPEPWLGRIHLGDSATVRVDAFPGQDFSGVVEQIARAAEFTPRNVQTSDERVKQVFGVKLRLDARRAELRAGMAADVSFKLP
ncbi:MAG: inner membrane protein YiaV precursor [Verrucomicrobiota bacterium]